MNSPTPKISLLTIAVLLATLLLPARTANAQQLQKGISVQMAVTSHATPMPDADDADAWIVTVRRDGAVHFELEMVSDEGLLQAMKSRRRKPDQRVYIKADARAPFAAVERALDAARADLFDSAVLLTAQNDSPAPGVMVPPTGLEVSLTQPTSTATVVELRMSGHRAAATINREATPWDELQDSVRQHLQDQTENVVRVQAYGTVPFTEVVRVIDLCFAAGAKITIATAEL